MLRLDVAEIDGSNNYYYYHRPKQHNPTGETWYRFPSTFGYYFLLSEILLSFFGVVHRNGRSVPIFCEVVSGRP